MIWQKVKFRLYNKSLIEVSQEIDGYLAEIGLNTDLIIINNMKNIEATSEEEAFRLAKEIANKFLDKLSWKCNYTTEIKPDWGSFEYMDPNTGQKSNHHLCFVDDNLTLIDKVQIEGNSKMIFNSEGPEKIAGESFDAESYFRRGKLSNDCFDQFRNFYLVVENISSFICQKKNVGEIKEQPMLELGLQECFQNKLPDLVNQANKVGIVATQSEVIPQIASFLYKDNRCCLSHAKEGGNKKKVPFNLKDEESVKKALPLMECVAKSFLAYAEKISAP